MCDLVGHDLCRMAAIILITMPIGHIEYLKQVFVTFDYCNVNQCNVRTYCIASVGLHIERYIYAFKGY